MHPLRICIESPQRPRAVATAFNDTGDTDSSEGMINVSPYLELLRTLNAVATAPGSVVVDTS